jgi:hypothetical protein
VANGYLIADGNAGFLVGAVNDHAILDIHLVADRNAVDVAPYHSIEPDAAFVTHLYISYDRGIGSDKTILSELGELPFYR